MAYNAVSDNIYNYYLTTYAPKSVTKYDTHKRSELRNLYNSMVNLNKESPLYLIPHVKESAEFAVGLKESARSLRHSIASLGGIAEDTFLNHKTAASSNEALVSASFVGDSAAIGKNSTFPSIDIGVSALASNQVNIGSFLDPNAPVKMPADTYSFDIGVNDLNYEFQFSIADGETNQNIQRRLSRLINNAGIGLNAEVITADTGETSMRIESDATGLPAGKTELFAISDAQTSKRAGMVEYLGLDYMARGASNALFTINGENREAFSNNFTVGKMYEITLNGLPSVEGEVATVGIKPDYESVADNIESLFSNYNDFVKSVDGYRALHSSSGKLLSEMNALSSHYKEDFESIGLSFQEDGSIAVDKNAIQQTAHSENGSEKFHKLKDFMNQLYRKTSQISLNPMHYVDKTVVAYKNPGHSYAAPYMTSNYSGMMFNYYL